MGDTAGECRAHGNLGAVHLSLGNNTLALKCYQEQLDRAQELKDSPMEAQAFGNMGITRMNLSHYEEAVGHFEQQLRCLELNPKVVAREKARAYGNLGDCYDSLGDFNESVNYHEHSLSLCLKSTSLKDQDKAYKGLGRAYKSLGNLQEALVSVVAHCRPARWPYGPTRLSVCPSGVVNHRCDRRFVLKNGW